MNSCIFRLVIYKASKRYATYSQFSSRYCWIQKKISSVFLFLCSSVISCSGKLMLSPCIENLYTQQELVREIDQNFVILVPFNQQQMLPAKTVGTQCQCFHVLADVECSLQKKDVLFLGPSMSLIIDHIFFFFFLTFLYSYIRPLMKSGSLGRKLTNF